MLPQSQLERKLLCPVDEGNVTLIAVLGSIAHEDGNLASGYDRPRTVGQQTLIAIKKCRQRRSGRQVARIVALAFDPPVRRVQPAELESIVK